MQDFIYKFGKRHFKKNPGSYRMCPTYYFLNGGGLGTLYVSQAEAARAFGLSTNTVNSSVVKSDNQTIEEFVNDTRINKFIRATDSKIKQIKNLYGQD